MEQLKQLEQNLIDAARKKQEAIDAAIKSGEVYDEQWEKIVATNPKFKQSWHENNIAQEAASVTKSDYSEIKAHSVKSLLEVTNPDDFTDIDAFGYRRSIEPLYEDDYEFIKAAVESGFLFLLKPDEAAIKTFVSGMAYEHKNLKTYFMPEKIFGCFPALGVKVVIKPTISDLKIAKLAK